MATYSVSNSEFDVSLKGTVHINIEGLIQSSLKTTVML